MNHHWRHTVIFLFLAKAFASSCGSPSKTPAAFTFVPTIKRRSPQRDVPVFNTFLFSPSHSPASLKRERSILSSAVSSDQNEVKKDTQPNNDDGPPKSNNNDKSAQDKNLRLDMPWSDFHAWALRDNLPKYTRILPGKTPQKYALWRTMMQDVPELSGYPISFLQEQCGKLNDKKSTRNETSHAASSSSSSTTSSSTTIMENTDIPQVLPYLDNFYFEPSGGLSGQVYGVPGLKDGTAIETSPVGQVEITIPLGYVLTEDVGVAYELGKPLAETDEGGYSLDGMSRSAGNVAGSLSKSASLGMAAAMSKRGVNANMEEEDPNVMLVRLGASTGLLLAGATAMNMLSHHLTVNVFWV